MEAVFTLSQRLGDEDMSLFYCRSSWEISTSVKNWRWLWGNQQRYWECGLMWFTESWFNHINNTLVRCGEKLSFTLTYQTCTGCGRVTRSSSPCYQNQQPRHVSAPGHNNAAVLGNSNIQRQHKCDGYSEYKNISRIFDAGATSGDVGCLKLSLHADVQSFPKSVRCF